MTRRETRQDALGRLATRVAAGEVVFFIGAGFSLDSERNSTEVLLARLLARIEALTSYIAERLDGGAAETAKRLRKGLRTTFWLSEKKADDKQEFGDLFDNQGSKPSDSILGKNLTGLAQNYYLINDWACSAFESLIEHLSALITPPGGLAKDVNAGENALLRRFHAIDPFRNTRELQEIDLDWLTGLHRYCKENPLPRAERSVAGKALFLETLGFFDEVVMGGKPMHHDLETALKEGKDRVRPRHHVLAWLAAEGLCPALVTTNYDMIVECAYRAAGILPLHPPKEAWCGDGTPLQAALQMRLPLNRRYRNYTRIASAAEFFTQGDAYQAALIHKIHGCVEAYRIRRARNPADYAEFRALLPTIVFTFREIQNWRDDSWSRDYLATLLRTHTVVFAGYSGADPVIHDTFRTVYEEMAEYSARVTAANVQPASAGARPLPGAAARAFFLDLDEKREFHGLEILRSASAAAGDPSPELTEHPNLVTFFRSNQPSFPNLDEVFLWVYHLTTRELQRQALEADLRRIAYQLFGRPCNDAEAAAIVTAFETLRTAERRLARAFDCGASGKSAERVRRRFHRLVAWTRVFQRGLMREYELALSLQNLGEGHLVQRVSGYPWYRPFSEHPEWAAWGAVLEIALRRTTAVYGARLNAWRRGANQTEAADHCCPMVVFRADPREPRRCVTIELHAMRLLFRRGPPARQYAALPPVPWRLFPETVPWWAHADDRLPAGTPPAAALWEWAALPPDRWKWNPKEYLEESSRHDRHA